jgi:hypothetical protein
MSFIDLLAEYSERRIAYPDIVAAMSGLTYEAVKTEGVVYTPAPIARRMINMAAPTRDATILEPSVGHGIFLHELLEYSRGWDFCAEETRDWFIGQVRAIDLNPVTVEEVKAAMSVYFQREHGLFVDPASFTNIVCGDGLLSNQRANIVIGNPPYVRTKNMEAEYLAFVRGSFSSCAKGNVDLFYAFIEHSANIADQVCLIVPNSVLSNVSAKPLMNMIKPRLTDVIDFQEKKMFEGIGVYTCILNIGRDVTETYNISNTLDSEPIAKGKISVGKTEGADFDVLSGIATLADGVFTVRKIDGLYYAKLGDEVVEVEKDCLVPFIKVTKQKTRDFSNTPYMIFPYDKRTAAIISEPTFKTTYPKAHAYMLRQQPKLNGRDKGKVGKYEAWYAYGRKQGFRHFTGEVVLVGSMVGGNCMPVSVDVSEIVAKFGRALFASGYVIPVTTANQPLCDFVLGDRFEGWLKENGKPFPGGFYGVTAKQLRGIRP